MLGFFNIGKAILYPLKAPVSATGNFARKAITINFVVIAVMLSGCAEQPTWDAYVSNRNVMLFVTFAPCGASYDGVPTGWYYHVIAYQIDTDGSYRLRFYDGNSNTPQSSSVYVTQTWYYGTKKLQQFPLSAEPSRPFETCGVLAVLPWSDEIARPYHMNEEPNIARRRLRWQLYFVFMSLILSAGGLCIGCIYAHGGFLQQERSERGLCYSAAVAAVAYSIFSAWVYVFLESRELAATLDYYFIYDRLQRVSGGLQPLHWSLAKYIFAGPPHPTKLSGPMLVMYFLEWTLIHVVWLYLFGTRVAVGVYYEHGTIPVVEARKRAEAKGRVITADEIISAVLQSTAGKSEWQLNILRRTLARYAEAHQGSEANLTRGR